MSNGRPGDSTSSRGAPGGRGRRLTRWVVVAAVVIAGLVVVGGGQAAGTRVITLTLDPTSILADNATQSTATAVLTDADGPVSEATVDFAQAATDVTAVTLTSCITGTNGTCTITIKGANVGTAHITASNTATDGTKVTSTEQALTLTAVPTQLALTLAPTSILANGTEKSTATAKVTDAGNTGVANETVTFTPTGAVTLSAETCKTVTDGTCTITITGSTVGTATITAKDGNLASTPQTLTLTQVPTKLVLTLAPSSILANATAVSTATATVTDAANAGIAGQTVNFAQTGTPVTLSAGTCVTGTTGSCSITINGAAAGATSIAATDGALSQSQPLILTAPPPPPVQVTNPSVTSLFAIPPTLVTNQSVTLVAAVATGGSPSGTITFYSRGVPIPNCGAQPVSPSNAAATCQTEFGASGSPQQLSAVFSPTTGSTTTGSSGAMRLSVAPSWSTVSLAVPGSARVGKATTYTLAVAPGTGGPIAPTGSAQFFDSGQVIAACGNQALIAGRATCTLAYKRAGSHVITARYDGDGNFTGATSGAKKTTILPARILGKVTAQMQWSFYYTPTYTKVLALLVKNVSPSASVTITCRGSGCPYAARTTKVPKRMRCGRNGTSACPTTNVDVSIPFRKRHLAVGAKIAIVVSRPNYIAKYYGFTMRARQGPAMDVSCVAPGRVRPGVGCSK